MPKTKTHKATAKRFVLTRGNKLKHRKPGQDHFNAREDGNTIRKKRRDVSAHKAFGKTVRILINR